MTNNINNKLAKLRRCVSWVQFEKYSLEIQFDKIQFGKIQSGKKQFEKFSYGQMTQLEIRSWRPLDI